MKSMKSITTAGLCLVAMLIVSMVAAGSASAAPHWLVCLPEHSGTSTTKWTTHQCKAAGIGGGWEWSEPTTTEKAVGRASLRLSDTVLGVKVTVLCTGELEGAVGPGKYDRVTAIPPTSIHCVAGENCEKLEGNAEPRNLPWQTELFESESTLRDKLSTGGAGPPGWKVTCRVLGVAKEDTCTSETGSTLQENVWSNGIGENNGELLVLGDFEANSGKAECSVTKKESGEVRGSVALLMANGWGLRATK